LDNLAQKHIFKTDLSGFLAD